MVNIFGNVVRKILHSLPQLLKFTDKKDLKKLPVADDLSPDNFIFYEKKKVICSR